MTEGKRYQVIVSDRAKRMLGLHIQFVTQVNPTAATRLQKQLIEGIQSLSMMPQRFPFLDEDYLPSNKYHKMFLGKWYLIIYQIRDDTVYVDYILDCRRDYSWLIHL